MTQKDLKEQARVSFAKVAEYQKRGVVHFHAIIRVDGPDGPATPPPSWATAALLADAITEAAASVQVKTPPADPIAPRVLHWGNQLDIRPVAADGELTDNAVADWHFTGLGHVDDLTAAIDDARQLTTPANRRQPPQAWAT